MPIVSSLIVEDRPQRDGRRAVRERHVDEMGVAHEVAYMAEPAQDVAGGMADSAARVAAHLAQTELAEALRGAYRQQPPVLRWATPAQFRAALRAAYRDAAGWEAAQLGKFVASLNLSDAQYTNLFGVSGAQLTQLKSRLSAQASRYDAVTSDQGS